MSSSNQKLEATERELEATQRELEATHAELETSLTAQHDLEQDMHRLR